MSNYKKGITFIENKIIIRQDRLHKFLTEAEQEVFNMLVDKIVNKQFEEENENEKIEG